MSSYVPQNYLFPNNVADPIAINIDSIGCSNINTHRDTFSITGNLESNTLTVKSTRKLDIYLKTNVTPVQRTNIFLTFRCTYGLPITQPKFYIPHRCTKCIFANHDSIPISNFGMLELRRHLST